MFLGTLQFSLRKDTHFTTPLNTEINGTDLVFRTQFPRYHLRATSNYRGNWKRKWAGLCVSVINDCGKPIIEDVTYLQWYFRKLPKLTLIQSKKCQMIVFFLFIINKCLPCDLSLSNDIRLQNAMRRDLLYFTSAGKRVQLEPRKTSSSWRNL